MTTLSEQRERVRPLLDDKRPSDMTAVYFAFHHPGERTQLFTYPETGLSATGYIALSRTATDLFRPFLTWRLPPQDWEGARTLIYNAMQPETAVTLFVPTADVPLVRAFFAIEQESAVRQYVFDPIRFVPEINLFVKQLPAERGQPRFGVTQPHPLYPHQTVVAASAGINWQTPFFAEVAVHTHPDYRRRGWAKSSLSALIGHILQTGRTPIYTADIDNIASLRLAQSLGFLDSGGREHVITATLQPRRF